jgi:ubiquinone/menaquinone biosynthesis C-methylase UbiE
MIKFSSKYRTKQTEIIDDLYLGGEEMKELLTDLKKVNKWLGGNWIIINGINKIIENSSKKEPITVLDVGCGDGEMLRQISRFAEKKGYNYQLIGVDANEFIISEAIERSTDFKNISFRQLNVFSEELSEINFDIALCTLFLHHLTDSEIIKTLNRLHEKAKVGVVVNDLQRSWLAFWLFKIVVSLFLKTKIAKHDGLVSVARGFRRVELLDFAKQIKNSDSLIEWRWAFRYQWILIKKL